MKQIVLHILVPAFALFAAACQPAEIELSVTPAIEHTVTADIITEGGTKTQLSGAWQVLWEEGDQIGLYFDGAVGASQFVLTDGAGTTSGQFSGSASGNNFVAVYPMSIAGTADGPSSINVTLPQVQTYSYESFGSGNNPMFAIGSGSNISFKNACALLRLSIIGHHSVKEISFTPNSPSVKVAGEAVVTFDTQGNPVLTMSSDALNSVTLSVPGIMLKDDEATDFYIALPPQNYKYGFTVKVTTSTGSMEKVLNDSFTMVRGKVHYSTPFKLVLDEGIEPSSSLSGEGTQNQPFLIQNLADLLYLQGITNSPDGMVSAGGIQVSISGAWFRQTADIDLSTICNPTEDTSWTPIGNYSSEAQYLFSGNYDGDGHSITGLYINNKASYQGFFGQTNGIVTKLFVEGEVHASSYAGIIAGAAGFLNECISKGSVESSGPYTGGMVGNGYDFYDCVNYADVNASGNYAGGITGSTSGTVSNCVNYGTIRNSGTYLGGIVGYQNYGSLFNCSNEGDIMGYAPVGGITGYSRQGSLLANCVNRGYVYSNYGYVGGICGHCDAYSSANYNTSILNCVNLGTVEVYQAGSEKDITGGICGYNASTIKNCYWIYDESKGIGLSKGIGEDAGVSGSNYPLTAAQMAGESTGFILYTASDQSTTFCTITKALNCWAYESRQILGQDFSGWRSSSNDNYPELSGEAPEKPSGDEVADFFNVSPTKVEIDGKGGSFEVTVFTNVNYELSSCPDWIVQTSVTNPSTNTWKHSFTVADNPNQAQRSGVASFCDSRGVCTPVTVVQAARPDYYFSTDYSEDGKVTQLQQATEGNGIDIVIMGDAFSDRQIANGRYRQVMDMMLEGFFSEEPYTSLRAMFNVYMVNVVSLTEGYEHEGQALSTWFGDGTSVGGDDAKCMSYARDIVGSSKMSSTLIIVAMNSTAYAGTCWMYYPGKGDYGDGTSVAYFPIGEDYEALSRVLHHEAGGHGFAKLDDEYAYQSMGQIPSDKITSKRQLGESGWWKNVDFTNVKSDVKWAKFFNDSRYQYDGLGVFEGACTYWTGAYRPTDVSIMRYNTGGFNAPSREAIWYRIHKLAYGDNWQYDYEEFATYDAVNRKTAGSTARGNKVERLDPPLGPPVVVNRSWEDVIGYK